MKDIYEITVDEGDGVEVIAQGTLEDMYKKVADLQEDEVIRGTDAAPYKVTKQSIPWTHWSL